MTKNQNVWLWTSQLYNYLYCFDTVGWPSERSSDLQKIPVPAVVIMKKWLVKQ